MSTWESVEYVKIDVPDDYPIILRRDEVESWLYTNFTKLWRTTTLGTPMLDVVSIGWPLVPRETVVSRMGNLYVHYTFPQENCSNCDSGEFDDPLHMTEDGVCSHDGSFVNVGYEILQGFVKPDTTEIVKSFLGEAYVK